MRLWKWIKPFGAGVTLAIIAACGGGTGAGQTQQEKSEAGQAQTKKDPVEIVFYSTSADPQESFEYRFGELLRAKFPNYTIKYIQSGQGATLNDLLTNGTKFDIFYATIGNYEQAIIQNDLQVDMTDLIKKHGIDLNRIEPTVVQALQQVQGGKIFALPVSTANLILYYNKDIFDKFGVPYPGDDLTWEQTLDLSKKMTRNDGGTQYFGMAASFLHLFRMNPLSTPTVDMTSFKPTINKDERWKTFFKTFFIDSSQEPGYQDFIQKTKSFPGINQFVKDRNVAMFPYLSSLIYAWPTEMQAFNWDWAALPHFSGSPGTGSQSYPAFFGLTKRSAHPDEAMEVLKYLLTDEFQLSLSHKGIMPVVKSKNVIDSFGKQSPFSNRRMQAVFQNKFAPISPKAVYDADILNIYTKYANAVNQNTMDMNTAFSKAEEEAVKFIDNFSKK
ncbi:ABC transporter substrate-binding protein [Paenibacillus ginsengarvi]|uniref:Extracellular solute-binding protein n=1 Tax=Paenibacillus ginsengarvi TaxID=400777 RepID=A0A3B0C4W4_9BACL|nr:extracellular solute-binding protein [Paenibacillus ginsengarvi]RKN78296.1 extracellular solute-binding protein [Paenibacillus ginsengarvi]